VINVRQITPTHTALWLVFLLRIPRFVKHWTQRTEPLFYVCTVK